MERHFLRLAAATVAAGLLLSGCTNWSSPNKWPRQYKFQGHSVQLYQRYVSGDYDTEEAQPGQEPATLYTYYAYVKDGREVRHGRATWWYVAGRPKAQTTYVHGVKQDRKSWYPDGTLRESVKVTDAGEESLFFDRAGRQFGSQTWDRASGKLTCRLGDKVVPLEKFMQEVARICYGRTRITPH